MANASEDNSEITESVDDWIIFDASLLNNVFPYSTYLDSLMGLIHDRKLVQKNGLAFPEKLTFIFEVFQIIIFIFKFIINNSFIKFFFFKLESLENLSPNQITKFMLNYAKENIYTHFEKFSIWIEQICIINPFFLSFEKILKIIFSFLFEDTLNFIHNFYEKIVIHLLFH